MTWVRIDDDFSEHAKVVSAGPIALALQVSALCYCNRNLTDGFVPLGVARRLLPTEYVDDEGRVLELAITCGMSGWDGADAVSHSIEQMVRKGIWEQTDGGYQIHDYDQYQPSREDVLKQRAEATKRKRRQRGKQKVTPDVTDESQRDMAVSHGGSHGHVTAPPYPYPKPNPVLGSSVG